jgi:hypothetical protein
VSYFVFRPGKFGVLVKVLFIWHSYYIYIFFLVVGFCIVILLTFMCLYFKVYSGV